MEGSLIAWTAVLQYTSIWTENDSKSETYCKTSDGRKKNIE